jgi:7-cyano-7-deazaguanine tRNA-ribosyltransferase
MEMRAHSHPALLTAVKRLAKYGNFIEKHSPATKNSGLFFYNSLSLVRPEVVRHQKLLTERYAPPKQAKTLILMPQTQTKPFHKSQQYKQIMKNLKQQTTKTHTCFYSAPFGIVPIELDEVYPLSQHETATPLDKETTEHVADQTLDYIKHTNYKTVILINDSQDWSKTILKTAKKACRQKQTTFKSLNVKEALSKKNLRRPLET